MAVASFLHGPFQYKPLLWNGQFRPFITAWQAVRGGCNAILSLIQFLP